ncbi:VOC family protein [Spirosoma sp. KNUC1025]|uniref:VOC family protein n=1 Tax=Spirosoma sp. KNUC1025 TaxID=2894082 RepID=UPI001E4DC4C5|nr:VOC family protein [Spirosoma sp. KNUC1025]UFH57589.1 VOC family protein [Spirosoma sp. KNUC1025]
MEVDHIFMFTHQAEQVASAFQRFGLSEGTANVHPGQGTACRRFFFQNAYLELVWVVNTDEIKNPVIERTKLWERSQHKLTEYCPVGLCLRTKQQVAQSVSLLFEDGWRYYSRYLPEGQFANIASNEDFPAEPMLFEMPYFGLAPSDYPVEKQQPLIHARGFQQLTKVTLTLPGPVKNFSPAINKVLQESILHRSVGETYLLALEFDGGKQGETKDFNPLIPLRITW